MRCSILESTVRSVPEKQISPGHISKGIKLCSLEASSLRVLRTGTHLYNNANKAGNLRRRHTRIKWAVYLSRHSDWLRVGRSEERIPVRARFSSNFQTDPGAHPASCTMGTDSFRGVNRGRDVTLTPHPF